VETLTLPAGSNQYRPITDNSTVPIIFLKPSSPVRNENITAPGNEPFGFTVNDDSLGNIGSLVSDSSPEVFSNHGSLSPVTAPLDTKLGGPGQDKIVPQGNLPVRGNSQDSESRSSPVTVRNNLGTLHQENQLGHPADSANLNITVPVIYLGNKANIANQKHSLTEVYLGSPSSKLNTSKVYPEDSVIGSNVNISDIYLGEHNLDNSKEFLLIQERIRH
jgi:hypothetical protein